MNFISICKMKIAVCSDLQLEFGPISLENTENADVLILSGDICVAKDLAERDSYNIRGENDKSNQIHSFFQECCDRFGHVLYVAGNHEHYHGDFSSTHRIFRDRLGYLRNLHVLDKETFTLGEVLFVGGTLWTDMNKEDPQTLLSIRGYMNDFRCVDNSVRMVNYRDYDSDNGGNFTMKQRVGRFTPEDSVEDHKAMLQLVRDTTAQNPTTKIVVVGHHAPSKMSTHPRYKDEIMVNGAYSSDLSEMMLDNRNIKLWTHGHTHEPFDYMIGSCRVVCNPRGYIHYEDRADQFELKFVEV